jgi:hypothetical protein
MFQRVIVKSAQREGLQRKPKWAFEIIDAFQRYI